MEFVTENWKDYTMTFSEKQITSSETHADSAKRYSKKLTDILYYDTL